MFLDLSSNRTFDVVSNIRVEPEDTRIDPSRLLVCGKQQPVSADEFQQLCGIVRDRSVLGDRQLIAVHLDYGLPWETQKISGSVDHYADCVMTRQPKDLVRRLPSFACALRFDRDCAVC